MNSKLKTQNSKLVEEWLETDGHGGFASGTVSGIRTRRYHALLLNAETPPTGRRVLVNGFDAWIETPQGRFPLTSQCYAPDAIHPDGAQRIHKFSNTPWPTWWFKFEDGTEITQEIFVSAEAGVTTLTWKLLRKEKDVRLFVRPFLSGRDYHGLHHENPSFNFAHKLNGEKVLWRPYDGVPGIYAMYGASGSYAHEPLWYRNFLYEEERARGLDDTEDLASPGVFKWDLSSGEAVWLLTAAGSPALNLKCDMPVSKFAEWLRQNERLRRAEFPSRLHRAADAYIVTGRYGRTIIAGYPWFADWGRDTFIALRGLCLATGRLDDARDILLAWAGTVSEGMLPNRFPDHGEQPEFNSVDASLWYIIAVHEYLRVAKSSADDRKALSGALEAILEGYSRGTRYGIHLDVDGLLACGVPGVQLTWMDAKVGDWVVTPRIGKPVEVQALWLNALKIGSFHWPKWREVFERGLDSFRKKFWNEAGGCLHDVVDVDHCAGKVDASFRPNQILAIGGLPFPLIEGEMSSKVAAAVEARLWTPLGLRSLAPGESGYVPHYQGGVRERDGAYHQGTVWPWLIGPFAEAWLRVHGNTNEARRVARARFLKPLLGGLDDAVGGHISEIADAEAPHTPCGCPFQAWSVGEVLRLDLVVLAEARSPIPAKKSATRRDRELTNA